MLPFSDSFLAKRTGHFLLSLKEFHQTEPVSINTHGSRQGSLFYQTY